MWEKVVSLFRKEPGLVVALGVAAVHTAVLFGLHLSADQQASLTDDLKQVATVLAELGGAAVIARSQTQPVTQ